MNANPILVKATKTFDSLIAAKEVNYLRWITPEN